MESYHITIYLHVEAPGPDEANDQLIRAFRTPQVREELKRAGVSFWEVAVEETSETE
jgi:hypothetical protein